MRWIGIRASDRPAFWLWNWVLGDALDLETLAAAYDTTGPEDCEQTLCRSGCCGS